MCDFVNKNLYSTNYLENNKIKPHCPQPIRFCGKILNHQRKYSTEDSKAASEEIQNILYSTIKRNEYISRIETEKTKAMKKENNPLDALSRERTNDDLVRSNCDSPNMFIFSMDPVNNTSNETDGIDIPFSPPSRSFNPILKNNGFNSNIYKREGAELGLLSFSPP